MGMTDKVNAFGSRPIPDWIALVFLLPMAGFTILPIFHDSEQVSAQHAQARAVINTHTQALFLYAVANGERYPEPQDWPGALIEFGLLDEDSMESSAEDGDGVSYIYVPGPFSFDPNQIIIYEDPKHWPDAGVYVGFADNHVDVVDHVTFNRMLDGQLSATESSAP
jgi:hypothetical protein